MDVYLSGRNMGQRQPADHDRTGDLSLIAAASSLEDGAQLPIANVLAPSRPWATR